MTFLSSNLIEHSPGLSRKGAISEVLAWILKWITNSACFWASLWGSSGIWLPHFKSCFTISACGRRSNLCTYFLIYKMKIIVVLYKILWGLNTHEVPKTEEHMTFMGFTFIMRKVYRKLKRKIQLIPQPPQLQLLTFCSCCYYCG